MKYITPAIVAELACFITAIFCLYRDKSVVWRATLLFMLITCVVEITGRGMALNKLDNNWLYNIYLIAEIFFTAAVYRYFMSVHEKSFKLILYGIAVITGLYIYEIIIHGIYKFNTKTTSVMTILFIFYGLYYFYLLIKDENYFQLNNYPPFWWVVGTLLFYFGTSVMSLLFTIFDVNASIFTHRHAIYRSLDFILYGFWSYSFICRYRQRKLTL